MCKSFVSILVSMIILFLILGCNLTNHEDNHPSQEYKSFASDTITININGYTYTGPRYNRDFQIAVQDTLKRIHSNDIYDNQYFQLDSIYTDSFYYKIGTLDKYIFGWADWYFKYAEPNYSGGVPHPNPNFVFDIINPLIPDFNSPNNTWHYNIPLIGEPTQDLPTSAMRDQFLTLQAQAN